MSAFADQLANQLADLVADTLAAADAWRLTGAAVVPGTPLDLLPAAEPWEPAAPTSARPAAPRPAPAAPRPAPAPPRPASAAPTSARPAPPRPAPAPLRPAPLRPAPVSSVPPAAAPAGAALFGGRWQKALRAPGEDLARELGALPACARCAIPGMSLLGAGDPKARLVVLAAGPEGERLEGEAGVMLDKMLLHVLSLERTDAFIIEANACALADAAGGCSAAVLAQLTILAPRVVLALGRGSAVLGAGIVRGEWSRHGSAEVLATFHPVDLLARPADKRATLEHLTAVRLRL